jgi:ABC-type polysaccharide/polyol phosphate transport system ATPase subunit
MLNVVVQDIYKHYRIYNRPADRLWEALFRKTRHSELNVLSGISFSLPPRQSLGIIGDNGAGKSTLLKILAGTVSPSRGSIDITGRVSALLELGAGFHPEFTGRQNIYLNASLLGISKEETACKEQGIIDFSELHDFIDRPVKTYSSGMYIRLAFSIATSVDPDILIIDEALSVGDMNFQRKCIDRMNRFREQGKTMIFCSHSMYHVQELCERVIWIHKGKIRATGPSSEIVSKYEEYCKERKNNAPEEQHVPAQKHAADCRILKLGIETADGHPTDLLAPYEDFVIKMEVEILKDGLKPQFGFAFVMADETPLSVNMTHHRGIECGPYQTGEKVTVRYAVKDFPVREGSYRLIGGVAEKSGLLWYEYKSIWPVKVRSGKGIGLLAGKGEWDISL